MGLLYAAKIAVPSRLLHPNGRAKHWAIRNRERKAYFDSCYYLFIHWRGFFPATAFPLTRVRLQFIFHFGIDVRRDGDNLIAWMKPAIDALVSSRVLSDDSTREVTLLPVVIAPPPPLGERRSFETHVLVQLFGDV